MKYLTITGPKIIYMKSLGSRLYKTIKFERIWQA